MTRNLRSRCTLVACALGLAMALAALLADAPIALAAATVERLGGTTRYQTMEKIVNAGFTRSEWAVVATADNFPDALASSALAGARDCPVLLTSGRSLSGETLAEIGRLGVRNVYLMGGEAAVSASVESSLRSHGVGVVRVAGADRVATSANALKEVRAAGSTSDTVIVATGARFADTLSIGPWAYRSHSPVILAKSDGTLSSDAVSAVKADPYVKRIVLVGGTAAVSDAVRSQLGAYDYVRLDGQDRYQTSAEVARWVTSTGGMSWRRPAVATGENFPDALAGAALVGSQSSTILLVPSHLGGHGSASPVDYAYAVLADAASRVETLYVLGGTAAIDADVCEIVATAVGSSS